MVYEAMQNLCDMIFFGFVLNSMSQYLRDFGFHCFVKNNLQIV